MSVHIITADQARKSIKVSHPRHVKSDRPLIRESLKRDQHFGTLTLHKGSLGQGEDYARPDPTLLKKPV